MFFGCTPPVKMTSMSAATVRAHCLNDEDVVRAPFKMTSALMVMPIGERKLVDTGLQSHVTDFADSDIDLLNVSDETRDMASSYAAFISLIAINPPEPNSVVRRKDHFPTCEALKTQKSPISIKASNEVEVAGDTPCYR
jgi:hypothetical protein